MKPKKNLNKLTLKKETISNLNQREMTSVKGGITADPGCPTCYMSCGLECTNDHCSGNIICATETIPKEPVPLDTDGC